MKNLYFIIIVFSLFSCKYNQKSDTTNESNLEVIDKIEVSVEDKDFKLKAKNNIVDYIILETTIENMINQVSRLIFFNEHIILLDDRNNKQLLFKKDGSYVDEISSKGKGPGETLHATDILISESDSIIEILDGDNLIKKDFNLKTISEQTIPFFTSNFLKLNSGNYWFFMNNQSNQQIADSVTSPNLIKTNSDLEIKEYHLPIEMKDLTIKDTTPFTRAGNNALFSLPFDNSIYCIRNNTVLKYEVSFGKHNVPDKIIQSAKNAPNGYERHMRYKEVFDKVDDLGSANKIQAPLENEKYLYFQFRKKRKLYGVLYNKQTKSVECGKFPDSFGQPMVLNDKNQLISVLFPHNFSIADKQENTLLKNKIEEANKNFADLKNPIIEIIQLK